MKRSLTLFCLLFVLISGWRDPAHGQATAGAADLPESADKYYRVLRKAPTRSHLYNRFLDAWLESRPLSELGEFFVARASAEGATEDDELLAATHFARRGEIEKALDFFGRALARNATLTEAHTGRAELLARQLEFNQAIASLDAALAQPGLEPAQRLEIGKQKGHYLVRNGNAEGALKVWSELLEAHPDDLLLHEDVVEAFASEGMLEEAISAARALAEKTSDPHDRILREFRIAELHLQAGKEDLATGIYEQVLPQSGAESWLEREILGRVSAIYRRKDDLAGLLSWIEAQAKAHPHRLTLLKQRAALAAETGDAEGAMARYREVLLKSPGDRETRNEFVDLLERLGKKKEAIEQQRALAAQFPEDAEMQMRLATLLHADGDHQGAETAARSFLSLSGGGEGDYLRVARFLEQAERLDLAATIYEEARKQHPASSELPEMEAAFLLRQDRVDAGLERYRELGKTEDVAQFVRITRALISAEQPETAFELLAGRMEDWKDDFTYLEHYLTTAFQLEQREGLDDVALRLLALADTKDAMNRALTVVERTFSGADRSGTLVDRLQTKSPRLPAETALLAQLLNRRGESTSAISLLEGAAAETEGESREWYRDQLVVLHHRNRNWEEAASVLQTLYEESGRRSSRQVQDLIAILREAGREAEALEWIPEWKKLSPGSIPPWTMEAELLQTLDRGDEAVAILRGAIAQFPDAKEIVQRLAALHADLGDPGEATRLYWKLYEDESEPAMRLRRVADLHGIASFEGTVGDLLGTFEERRRSNPGSPDPLLAIAEIHRLEEDWTAREQALLAASRLREDDLALRLAIADAQLEQKNGEAAIATLEQAAGLDRTSGTLQRIARIHLESGDPTKGYAILTEIAADLDKGATPQELLVEEMGDIMIGNGTPEVAVTYLAPYLEAFPSNYRLRYLRAVALEEVGNYEEAAEAFLHLLSWPVPENDVDTLMASLPPGEREREEHRWDLIFTASTASPGGLPDWFNAQTARYFSYGHRDSRAASQFFSIPSLSKRRVLPPLRIDFLRPMALAHLIEMTQASDLDAPVIAPKLVAARVADAEILLQHFPLEQGQRPRHLPVTLLREHPGNLSLQAKWIGDLATMGPGPGIEKEDYLRAARLFLDSDPAYAAAAALLGMANGGDPALEDLRASAMKQIPADATVPPILFAAWSRLAAWEGEPEELAGKRATLAEDRLAELEDLTLRPGAPEFRDSPLVSIVAQHHLEMKDPAGAIRYLEAIIQLSRENGRSSSSLIAGMFNGFYGSEPFSHAMSEEYPTGVLLFLRSLAAGLPGKPAPTPEVFAAMIDGTKDPLIRFHLEKASLEKKDLLERLHARATAADLSADEALVYGSYQEEENDHEGAIAFFLRGRDLVATPMIRERLDSAILNAGMQAGREKANAWKEAQQAALRLFRTSAIPTDYRIYVAELLESLDLPREARKMLGNSGGKSSSSSVVQSQRKEPHQLIKDFLADDKTDEALALAVREVSVIGREAINNRYGNWQNQFWYLRETIEESGLASRIFDKLMEKAGNDHVRRLLETATAAELFQQEARAKALYERVLELDRHETGAQARLAWLAAKTQGSDPDAVAPILARVDQADFAEVFREIVVGFDGNGYDRPEGEVNYTIVLACLNEIKRRNPSDDGETPGLLTGLFHQITSQNDWGGVEMAYLHDRTPLYSDRGRSYNLEDNRRADEMRHRAYDQFCELAFETPSLSRLAFASRSAWEISRGGDPAKWEAKASQAGAWIDPSQLDSSLNFPPDQQSDCHPLYGPEEFLIRRAWKRGDRAAADQVVERAPESLHHSLAAFRDLYFDPEEGFVETAMKFRTSYARFGGMGAPAEFHVGWAIDDRGIPYATAMDYFRQSKLAETANRQMLPAGIRIFLHSVGNAKGFTGYKEILDDFRKGWVGDDLDAIREEVKKSLPSGGGRLNWNSGVGGFFYQCLAVLGKDERLLFPTLEVAKECGIGYDPFFDQTWRYRSGEYFQSEENVRRFFAHAPWFGEIAAIDAVPSGVFQQSGSLMGEFFRTLDGEAPREAIRETISARPDSFFKSLSLSLLDGKKEDRPAILLAAVGKHLAEFEALDDSRARDWARLLEGLGVNGNVTVAPDSESGRARQWLISEGMKGIETRVEELLGANRFSDFESSPDRFEKEFTRLMDTTLARGDSRKAAEMFFKGWNLIHKEQLAGGWRGTTSYNGWPVSSQLIHEWLGARNGGLEDIAFWVAVQQMDSAGEVPHSGWSYHLKFNPRLRKVIDLHGGPANTAKSIPAMLADLHKAIGGDPADHAAILCLTFHDFVKNYPPAQWADLISAADAVAASDRPESRLAEHLAMTSRFLIAGSPPDQVPENVRSTVPEPDRWRPHALALVSDETKPGSWRMPLANLFACYGIDAVDDDLAMAIGRAAADALEAEHAFNAWNLIHSFRAFCPREEREGWNDIAARIDTAWWRRNRHNGDSRYTGKPFDPVDDAILATMEVSLRLGKPDAYTRYRKVFGNELLSSDFTRALFLLVEHGYGNDALQLIRNHPTTFDGAYYFPETKHHNVRLTPANLARIEEFLGSIDDPDLARYTRALLEAAPDPTWPQLAKLKLPQPWVGRGARMMRAAAGFEKTPWKDEALKRRTLQQILLEPQTAVPLATLLATEHAGADLADIISSNSSIEIEGRMRPVAAHCWNEMIKGNLEPFESTWSKIASAPGTAGNRNDAREEVARFMWATLRRNALTMKPEELGHVFTACRHIFENYRSDQTHFTHHDALYCAWVASAAIAGRSEEMRVWFIGLQLERSDRGRLLKSMESHHEAILPTLMQMLKTAAPTGSAPVEVRQRVVTGFFADPLIQTSFNRAANLRDNLFTEWVKQKILTRTQVLEIGEALHEAWPRGGRAAIELRELSRLEGDQERLILWGGKVIDEFTDRTPVPQRIDAIIGHAEILAAGNRPEEAKKALAQLPRDPEPGAQPGLVARLKTLREKLP